jgi:formylglycine-generating enzyme required for sulfatase activity
MTPFFNHDNWVEIPAGECQLGLSDAQREKVWSYFQSLPAYRSASPAEQALARSAFDKRYAYKDMSREESTIHTELRVPFFREPQPEQVIWLGRFYIMRFPVTVYQFSAYERGIPADRLPGTLDEPEYKIIHRRWQKPQKLRRRKVCSLGAGDARTFCEYIGGRLPTSDEWEKAARGTDGRLYPWGDEWDERHGYFYRGQPLPDEFHGHHSVDTYPSGVSPYGVWAMAGGLPEMVTDVSMRLLFAGRSLQSAISVTLRGTHPKEVIKECAYYEHVLAQRGYGYWSAMRAVLDRWPRTQWQGIAVDQTDQGLT